MSEFVTAGDRPADFFDRLEAELHAAAERRPSRRAGWSPIMRNTVAVVAGVAVIALALVPVLAVLGGGRAHEAPSGVDSRSTPELPPMGTVIPEGGDVPPGTVVATGVAPVAGPWQLQVSKSERLADPSSGEEYQPAGLPCLNVVLLNAPDSQGVSGSGHCGEFPRTPGFGRAQVTVGSFLRSTPSEVLVYGRAPEGAARVMITPAGGGPPLEAQLHDGLPDVAGDFYLRALEPDQLEGGRINWVDESGEPGSRGLELLPP